MGITRDPAVRDEIWFDGLSTQIADLMRQLHDTGKDAALKRLDHFEESVRTLMSSVFCDIVFSPKAISKITLQDPRIFRVLKAIDWRLAPAVSGMQPRRFQERDGVWEYRFSRKGRIFVEFPDGGKPTILDIDGDHDHEG